MPPRRSTPTSDPQAEIEMGPPPEPNDDGSVMKSALAVFNEDWEALPLAAKLAKITGSLGNIPKKGWNPNQRYKFARETDLVGTVRPYLAAAGIHISFSVTDHQILQRPNPEAKGMLTYVDVHYAVSDGKETIEGYMPGYGMDAGDKGVYKAITGAKKYILMTLFLIDTGDDPEADTSTDKIVEAAERLVQMAQPMSVHDIVMGEDRNPVIEPSARTDIVRGGRTTEATDTQRDRLISHVRDMNWSARQFLNFIRETLDTSLANAPEESPAMLRDFINAVLNSLSPEDMGKLIQGIEAGREPDYAGY